MSTPDDNTPRPADELDLELINLRKTREGIGPVLAFAVVALSTYVMVLLLPDLGYWAGAKEPRELGAVTAAGELPTNTWVTLSAIPDRPFASRLRARQDIGRRLVPVLGTSRGVWLELEGDGTHVPPSYDERYSGRLRRLDGLGFADELEEYVGAQPPHPHYVDPARLGADVDVDLAGDRIAIGPGTAVDLEERIAARVRVTVIFTETLVDEPRARAALAAALGTDPGEPTARAESASGWELDGDLADVRARLGEAKLFAARAEPVFRHHVATWGDLAADDQQVTLAGHMIPRASVVRASVFVPEHVPADALILVSGDEPGAYWYVPIVFSVLALLSLLMVWAFARTLGLGKKPAPAAPAPAGP